MKFKFLNEELNLFNQEDFDNFFSLKNFYDTEKLYISKNKSCFCYVGKKFKRYVVKLEPKFGEIGLFAYKLDDKKEEMIFDSVLWRVSIKKFKEKFKKSQDAVKFENDFKDFLNGKFLNDLYDECQEFFENYEI